MVRRTLKSRVLAWWLVDKHPGHRGEVKWNKINNRASYDLAADLVRLFFERKWMAFHCIVVTKALIKRSLHKDYDEAWRKNLCNFLVNKARIPAKRQPSEDHQVHVWADEIPSRYAKTAEALDIIGNRKLARYRSPAVALKVFEHDSKAMPIIQLCDLLLGAVVQSAKPSRGYKADLQTLIARQLGWEHLWNGTYQSQTKFNIWHLHDHGKKGRKVRARQVKLGGWMGV